MLRCVEQFLQFRKKCTGRRNLCLKYAAEKKRDRGALLLHLTPANRLHAAHSFPPRRAHSRTFPDSFFLRKISTQISVCTFSPDLFKKPHRSTASLNQSCRTDSIRLSSVGSLPSVILLICMRVCAGWFGRCRRQRFASEIYVCKKHSAVSSDDDCERNAEKADGDAGLFSRT